MWCQSANITKLRLLGRGTARNASQNVVSLSFTAVSFTHWIHPPHIQEQYAICRQVGYFSRHGIHT